MVTECLLPDWMLSIADNVLNAPVAAIVGLLYAGKILKLCGWFRGACIMPITTKVSSYVDSFIVTFTQGEAIIINSLIGLSFLIYIYLSYRHFFHGRKGNS